MRRGSFTLLAAAPLALLAAFSGPVVNPGVVYEITTTDYRESPARVDTAQLQIEGSNLAMGFSGSDNDGRMVFRGEAGEMLMINDSEQSYILLDEAALEALSAQMNSMMAQMEEMLAQLPPEQRAMVERMRDQGMGGMPGMPDMGAAAPEIDVRQTGRSDTRAGFEADEWEVYEDGELRRRMWVAAWDEIDGAGEARDAMAGMVEFFDDFLEAMPNLPGSDQAMFQNPFRNFDMANGMPVLTQELDANGEVEQESMLTGVEQLTLPPSTFEAPDGYERQELPGG